MSGDVTGGIFTAIAVAVMLACAGSSAYAAVHQGAWLVAAASVGLFIGGTIEWLRRRQRDPATRAAVDEMFGWLLFTAVLHVWTATS